MCRECSERADMLCPACESDASYSERYDAHFCVYCDAWIEPVCDLDCTGYCNGRPEKPSVRA
jgi:hypothetical protein